jgi:Ca-activated chloride channel family protein
MKCNPGLYPGESGIKLAYTIAKKHFIEKGNNRVILATDGDFNVGLTNRTGIG